MTIAQLTDLHITRDGPQARFLRDALAWIAALRPQPVAVVLSGDLTNAGRASQYAALRDIIADFPIPIYLVPGNHDGLAELRQSLATTHYPGARGGRLDFVVELGPVRLIGLDTARSGRAGGALGGASLSWFDAVVSASPTPALVFMHHPPFRTGVNLADLLGFKGLRRFRRIVVRRSAVRRIVAGHIHCERSAMIGNALATTCISTTPQVVPELFERHIIGLRPEPAGFALHTWRDGAFASTTYVNVGFGRFIERVGG